MSEQEKKDQSEKEKKAKANMKVMAKIAYKEWKERKVEEDKQIMKQERMIRRQQLMDNQSHHESNMKRGDVMLAYGLNKNLKKLRNRPRSAKQKKQKKTHKRVFEENL